MNSTSKDALILQYRKTGDIAIRDQIVETYMPLVEYIARKLSFTRDDIDDLVQVGTIGLLRSVDRFEPSKEVDFSTFASPNIIGEIKHYFRDKRGILKVPRKLQEQYSRIKRYIKENSDDGKSPTIAQIASALELPEETVLESIEAWQSSTVVSLDSPAYSSNSKGDGTNQTLLDSLGGDHKEDAMINRVTLREAILKLGHRERKIIFLRFYRGLSQSEIADKLNLSQMHISRLLTASLKELKHHITKH
ncbi:sigma-70 family RNA polymerase sigma factor [bacterium]|nr:sigma-70 family RNA polymerase sigma factor [bacterium]